MQPSDSKGIIRRKKWDNKFIVDDPLKSICSKVIGQSLQCDFEREREGRRKKTRICESRGWGHSGPRCGQVARGPMNRRRNYSEKIRYLLGYYYCLLRSLKATFDKNKWKLIYWSDLTWNSRFSELKLSVIQNRNLYQNLSVLRAFGPLDVKGTDSLVANLKTVRRE